MSVTRNDVSIWEVSYIQLFIISLYCSNYGFSLSSTKYGDLCHIIKHRQQYASIIWRHMWINYSMCCIFLHECTNSIYDVQFWNNSLLDQIRRFRKISHRRPKFVLVGNYQTIGMQHLMFPQCGWVCNFTYSEIYIESQDTLNNMLQTVTFQNIRIYRTLVADSRSQWKMTDQLQEYKVH